MESWHVWYETDTKAHRAKGKRILKKMGCIDIECHSQYALADDRKQLFVIGKLPPMKKSDQRKRIR